MNIIELAQKWGYWDGNTAEFNDVGLEEFAAAIRAEEREACVNAVGIALLGASHELTKRVMKAILNVGET